MLKRNSIFALFASLLLTTPAHAEDAATRTDTPPVAATRIEADDGAGVIRFFVKGEPVAFIDETGLHVRENVSYGGTMTDAGTEAFDRSAVGQTP